MKKLAVVVLVTSLLAGCDWWSGTSDTKDTATIQKQQDQYAKAQPIPVFDWSLERNLVIELYKVRNQNAVTHSVWRSNYGQIEGDCPSYGYGIPYDTSLTNPLVVAEHVSHRGITTIEQAEPNGLFASKNTSATWVMCLGKAGTLEPVYVETKVTVYPGPVTVDYEKNRVTRNGVATVTINKK